MHVNGEVAHMAAASDLTQLSGLKALVYSAYMNTRSPASLVFHIFVLYEVEENHAH